MTLRLGLGILGGLLRRFTVRMLTKFYPSPFISDVAAL